MVKNVLSCFDELHSVFKISTYDCCCMMLMIKV